MDGRNRYFDKAIEIVIANSGRAGVNGEVGECYSMLPITVLKCCGFFLMIKCNVYLAYTCWCGHTRTIHGLCITKVWLWHKLRGFSHISNCIHVHFWYSEPASDPSNTSSTPLAPIRKLQWHVNHSITSAIQSAAKTCKELIDNTSSILLHYDGYGGRYMKEVGKQLILVSSARPMDICWFWEITCELSWIAKTAPDSYVQLAMQLAWRRMHTEPTAIYESASTRAFLHGRTETIRSLSTESWQFACDFDNDNVLVSIASSWLQLFSWKSLWTHRLCNAHH